MSLLNEKVNLGPDHHSLGTCTTMFQAARWSARRCASSGEPRRRSSRTTRISSERPSSSAGRSSASAPRLFQIYQEGNFIEATKDTAYFQIGEHKYGKPILDRVANPQMSMGNAAKLLLISFDSTLRSNLSVGMPIDLLIYRKDELKVGEQRRIEERDPYFRKISAGWSQALRNAFAHIDEYGEDGEAEAGRRRVAVQGRAGERQESRRQDRPGDRRLDQRSRFMISR